MSNVYQVQMKTNHRRTITGEAMGVTDGAVTIYGTALAGQPKRVVAVFPLGDINYAIDLSADGRDGREERVAE